MRRSPVGESLRCWRRASAHHDAGGDAATPPRWCTPRNAGRQGVEGAAFPASTVGASQGGKGPVERTKTAPCVDLTRVAGSPARLSAGSPGECGAASVRARVTLQGMSALSTPFVVSMYCWFALEVGLVVRDLVRQR